MALLSSWSTARGVDVRPVTSSDRSNALDLCAADPAANVYVAARILETDLDRAKGAVLGYYDRGRLVSIVWANTNIVPVACDDAAAEAFAGKFRRTERAVSSIFGPADQVDALWRRLERSWRRPFGVRPHQPLMAVAPTDPLGVAGDARVRPAREDEWPIVVPAAAAMFTEEIGYAPYTDRVGRQTYEQSVRALIRRGHCFVIVEDGAVVFKADAGSAAVGACQIQGVWVAPARRGEGICAPAMASVVGLCRTDVAPLVTLYVNDYNAPARSAYARAGFRDVGEFATVLL